MSRIERTGTLAPSLPSSPPPEGICVVQPGDTLAGIASEHGLNLKQLLQYNPEIKNPDKIFAGQRIHVVPNQPPAPPPAPVMQSTARPAPGVATETRSFLNMSADFLRRSLHTALDTATSVEKKVGSAIAGFTETPAAPVATPLPTEESKIQGLAESKKYNADALTDRLFWDRHPELEGKSLKKGAPEITEWLEIKEKVVEPQLNLVFEKRAVQAKTDWSRQFSAKKGELTKMSLLEDQNKYNAAIARGAAEYPALDPKLLKSLLIHESNFDPKAVSPTGCLGIAQFEGGSARGVGLIVNDKVDDRLNPDKAIPGAARLLKQKANYLDASVFKDIGKPQGDEYWKFVLAAYNGGQGTVRDAMEKAYDTGLQEAQQKGLAGSAATDHAKAYAAKWDNIFQPDKDWAATPLGQAIQTHYSEWSDKDCKQKFLEMGNYPDPILKTAQQ